MTTDTQEIKVRLVSSEHGFKDFDVTNLANVHRACVPHNIRKGDVFNVYCSNCVKLGAVWCGEVVRSLANFAETNTMYQQLCMSEYAGLEHAAKQAKTKRELCRINEDAESLFCQGKLKMTDKDWIQFTKLIRELHPKLPV
jgi:hypothetical protein